MSEDVPDYKLNNDLWVKGWLLGKYEQKGMLPKTIDQTQEWYEGFTKGAIEIGMYTRLDAHMRDMLDNDVDTLALIGEAKERMQKGGGAPRNQRE